MKQHFALSESNEWYTPSRYIEAARAALGLIDLDPASCSKAQETVKANRSFTIDDDALSKDWVSSAVWLNPPYGKDERNRSNQGIWSQYLIRQYQAGNVSKAVLLVNACTSEKWFQPLWKYPICFTDHRIKFVSPPERSKKNQPSKGNAFIYFGKDPDSFYKHFKSFGEVRQ